MSNIAQELRALLLADATVAGLVGTRVYPNILPQSPTVPAISYLYVSGSSDISTDGPTGLASPTLQIDCWGNTYAATDALFQAVRSAINGYSGAAAQGIFLVRQRDLYDYDVKLHRRTADFDIWHTES